MKKKYMVYNYDTQNVEAYFDNEIEALNFAEKFPNATVYEQKQPFDKNNS